MNVPDSHRVVLVVEDEDSLREMLTLVLKMRAYRVISCGNGLEAKEQLDGVERVDVMLLDIRMPGVDGKQLLSYVRHHPRRASVPVICMSGFSDETQANEMRALGADAFLGKPFSISALMALLEEILRPERS